MRQSGSDDLETTPSVLAAVASDVPVHEAVVGPEGTLTYAELAERAATLAARLTDVGVEPGDRVGMLLPNGVRWLVGMLGIHAAGASVVPLSTFSRGRELGDALHRAGTTKVLAQGSIFGHDFERDLSALQDNAGVRAFVWDQSSAYPDGLPSIEVEDPIGHLRSVSVEANDEALLLFTSGSTAAPKGVRHAHGPVVRNGRAIGDRHHLGQDDRLWLASPLFFVFGCGNAVPNVLTHAATLCLQEGFEPDAAGAFIEAQRCTAFYGLAPVTRAIVASGAHRRHDLSSLRTGTTSFTADDRRLAIEELGIHGVCSAYGLTEGLGHSTMTDADDPPEVRMGSEGRVLPTQELRITTDNGPTTGVDEVGEIQLRGCITMGYLDEDHDRAGFTPDGWFRTGDLGFLDADGRLHFVGRSSEMIKTRGFSVSPTEVEEVLAAHPDVDQVFVFSIPGADGDQEIGCVVASPAANADALVAELPTWARSQLSSYKVPRHFWVRRAGELPMTSTGKVSKRLLREQLMSKATSIVNT